MPERYRHELLAKSYNLSQRNKSTLAYYDEIQQLIMKLKYNEIMNHTIIHFKNGLTKDISSCITIHKFVTLEEIIQAALEIERGNKERTTYKPKVYSSTNTWRKSKEIDK